MVGQHRQEFLAAGSRSLVVFLISTLVCGCTIHRYTMVNKTPSDARDAIVLVRPGAKPVPLGQFPDRFDEKGPAHVVIAKGTRITVRAAPYSPGIVVPNRPLIACGHAEDGAIYVCRNRADSRPFRIPADRLKQLDITPRSLLGPGIGVGAGLGLIAYVIVDMVRARSCAPDNFECQASGSIPGPLAIGGGALIGAVVGAFLTERTAYAMRPGGWSATAIR